MQLRFNLAGGEGNLVSHIGLLPGLGCQVGSLPAESVKLAQIQSNFNSDCVSIYFNR